MAVIDGLLFSMLQRVEATYLTRPNPVGAGAGTSDIVGRFSNFFHKDFTQRNTR